MRSSHRYGLVLLAALASLGASYRTPNFVVQAPDAALAEQVGKWAEHYRSQKAKEWLGQEMPAWRKPCPLRVTLSDTSGGATTFAFDDGRILSIDMHVEGTRDRLFQSVLPHEVTHTVLAHYFRKPIPRWADEGGSVLSEDEQERAMHERMIQQILRTPGRAIPLRRLFTQMNYPRDVMVLFAQGYSVTRFLVEASNRQTFLAFVADGMDNDWDKACAKHYSYKNVEQMEAAWVKWVRAEKRKHERETSRQRLEKELELLRLENQLLKSQLEQDRLKAKIRHARRALKKLQEEEKPSSQPAPATPVPVNPPSVPLPAVPAPPR